MTFAALHKKMGVFLQRQQARVHCLCGEICVQSCSLTAAKLGAGEVTGDGGVACAQKGHPRCESRSRYVSLSCMFKGADAGGCSTAELPYALLCTFPGVNNRVLDLVRSDFGKVKFTHAPRLHRSLAARIHRPRRPTHPRNTPCRGFLPPLRLVSQRRTPKLTRTESSSRR